MLLGPFTTSMRSMLFRSISEMIRETSRRGVLRGTPSTRTRTLRPRRVSLAPEMFWLLTLKPGTYFASRSAGSLDSQSCSRICC